MGKYNDLLEKLIEYCADDNVPMHMPGAKRNPFIYHNDTRLADSFNKEDRIRDYEYMSQALSLLDITEIDGFDNMHNPDGIIKDIAMKAKRLYKSDLSLLLVNGSTAGILAAISGVCHKGDRVIVARNCHVSVFNAIYLNELDPEYLIPQLDSKTAMFMGISLEEVKELVEKKPDNYRALILTSPTYEGNVSEIEKIAKYLHEKGIALIVDEAHGAHFPFSKEFPKSAIELGADIVINSIHKTLPAPTMTALLHLNSDLINYERVKRYWNIYQSTSPSYLLMAGIDRALSFVELYGKEAYKDYTNNLKALREQIMALKYIKLVNVDDISKIVLTGPVEIENFGKKLFDTLLTDYHIQLEMASFDYVIAMTALGDKKEYYDRFIEALREIDKKIALSLKDGKRTRESLNNKKLDYNKIGVYKKVMTPSKAIEIGDEKGAYELSINDPDLVDKIAVNSVLLYPPGMPVVNSGERINREKIHIIKTAMEVGIEVMGLNHDLIKVIKE